VCLKKDEDDHGPLEHQRTSRLLDGPFCSLPGSLHANNGHHLQDILFKTMRFKTSHVVVSESKNKIFVSRIVFFFVIHLKIYGGYFAPPCMIALCSDFHAKHINTHYWHKVEFINNHYAVKG